jgi:hypothetical protein
MPAVPTIARIYVSGRTSQAAAGAEVAGAAAVAGEVNPVPRDAGRVTLIRTPPRADTRPASDTTAALMTLRAGRVPVVEGLCQTREQGPLLVAR